MDPLSLRLTETISVSDDFKKADDELKVQLDRLGIDNEKWDLVRHLASRFEKLASRHDGLQVMTERAYSDDTRGFIIEELRSIAAEKRSITAEIKRVMDELEDV